MKTSGSDNECSHYYYEGPAYSLIFQFSGDFMILVIVVVVVILMVMSVEVVLEMEVLMLGKRCW